MGQYTNTGTHENAQVKGHTQVTHTYIITHRVKDESVSHVKSLWMSKGDNPGKLSNS